MMPIRDAPDFMNITIENLRAVVIGDFVNAFDFVKSSVAPKDLIAYEEWNKVYGSFYKKD